MLQIKPRSRLSCHVESGAFSKISNSYVSLSKLTICSHVCCDDDVRSVVFKALIDSDLLVAVRCDASVELCLLLRVWYCSASRLLAAGALIS